MEFLNGPWGETLRFWGSVLVLLYLVHRITEAPWSKYDHDQVDKIVERLRKPKP